MTATVNHHVLPSLVLQLYGSSSGAVQASVQPSAAGEAQAGAGAQQDFDAILVFNIITASTLTQQLALDLCADPNMGPASTQAQHGCISCSGRVGFYHSL
jgi:hypothetical protein